MATKTQISKEVILQAALELPFVTGIQLSILKPFQKKSVVLLNRLCGTLKIWRDSVKPYQSMQIARCVLRLKTQ